MADPSPISVGLLTGSFALGGIVITAIATFGRDIWQARREAKQRRVNKLDEMVAAVFEFDHWLSDTGQFKAYGVGPGIPRTASPVAKVQSISAVYFPQFTEPVRAIKSAADKHLDWIYTAEGLKKTLHPTYGEYLEGFEESRASYATARDALLNAIQKYASEHPA